MKTRQGEEITWSDEPWNDPGSWVVHAAGYSHPVPVGEYEERPPLEDGMVWTGNDFIKGDSNA